MDLLLVNNLVAARLGGKVEVHERPDAISCLLRKEQAGDEELLALCREAWSEWDHPVDWQLERYQVTGT